jgi:hypothetical protein
MIQKLKSTALSSPETVKVQPKQRTDLLSMDDGIVGPLTGNEGHGPVYKVAHPDIITSAYLNALGFKRC